MKDSKKRRTCTPVSRASADVLAERIAELGPAFPEAFAEGKVDFEKFRATLMPCPEESVDNSASSAIIIVEKLICSPCDMPQGLTRGYILRGART